MNVIIFDTETTGLPKKWKARIDDKDNWPYIVQFSWILYNVEKNIIISCNDYIVQLPDGMEVPVESTNIHGITTETMREKGIECSKVIEYFSKDLSKAQMLIAHNLKFDKTMVRVESYRNRINNIFKDKMFIEYCTMLYGKDLCQLKRYNKYSKRYEVKYPKLVELHEHLFHETPENLHNSLIDVIVCFRCFYKMQFNSDVYVNNPQVKLLK